jgi:hypothetical protein
MKKEKQTLIEKLKEINESIKKAEREAYSKGTLVSGADYRGDIWLPKGHFLVKIEVEQKPHHEDFHEAEYFIVGREGDCGYADEIYYTCNTIVKKDDSTITLIGRYLKSSMVLKFIVEDMNGKVIDEWVDSSEPENGWAVIEYQAF